MVTIGASSAAPSSTRPSDARRERLGQQIKVPTVSNFFPIEGYYNAAAKVYDELQQTSLLVQTQVEATMTLEEIQQTDPSLLVYDMTFNAGLDMCYLLAKRYCLLCVDEIPNHNYYNSVKYQRLKHQHVQQMKKVVRVLERVVEQMDVQEQILRILQEQKERTDQLLLLERHRLVLETSSSASSRQMSGPDRQPTTTPAMTVQESALEKLKRLLPPPPPSSTTTTTATTIPTPTTSSTRYRWTDDDENDNNDDQHDTNHAVVSLDGMQPLLPPALQHDNMHHSHPTMVLPPPTPPSYDAVITAMQNRPARAVTTTTTTSLDTSYIRPPPPEPTATKKETIRPPPPMRQQQEYYKTRYMKYQQMGKIQISSIDTYQGRISASTNGCTVISALIVARHLQDPQRYTAISNATIQNVIDVQCGPILRTIRNKLGLGGHALIIPSDVHDHLVDAKILLQEQFTGAAGGNIMSPLHYQEFLQLLSDTTTTTTTTHQNGSSNGSSPTSITKSNGKAGATLFFREHVISIVKSIDPNTKQSYYDFIDSMPGIMQNGQSRATRTRCTDMESLQVLLLWYASRKFSDANCNYIDRNPWDDNTADLDPRVFQGFVWSS